MKNVYKTPNAGKIGITREDFYNEKAFDTRNPGKIGLMEENL